MNNYRVFLTSGAQRDLKKLPVQVQSRVLLKVHALSSEPRPAGCIKLSGYDEWRIRVGKYRILYRITDSLQAINVIRVDDRSDVYRK